MALPIDLGKVKRVADKIQNQVETEIRIDIYEDETCNYDMSESVKTYLSSADEGVKINYIDVKDCVKTNFNGLSFAVIIAGESADCAFAYDALKNNKILKFVVSLDPGSLIENFENNNIAYDKNEIICPDIATYTRCAQDNQLLDFNIYNSFMDINIKYKISEWIYEVSASMQLAYAEKFPFLRSKIAGDLIYACSLENAGIGIIKFLPSADMPLMTLNQVRMLLELAAIYGYDINEDRVLEIIAIVAGAFGMRYISNYVKKKSPIPKFIVDGSFGLSGTVLLGNIAKEYFASGLAIDGLVDKCKAYFQK